MYSNYLVQNLIPISPDTTINTLAIRVGDKILVCGGGQTANITLGFANWNGYFQPLKFAGKSSIAAGSARQVQTYYTWNYPQYADVQQYTCPSDSSSYNDSSNSISSSSSSRSSDSSLSSSSSSFSSNSSSSSSSGSCYYTVHSGEVITSRTIQYPCRVTVYGTANNTQLISGGFLYVESGGIVNYTQASGHYIVSGISAKAFVQILQGASANSTTLESGGYMQVYGSATGIAIDSGGGIWVRSNGSVNSLVAGAGTVAIHDAVANNTTLNSGCHMEVSSDGTANYTTVNDGGDLWVGSVCTVNSTVVSPGGRLFVLSQGSADSVTLHSGGRLIISCGGIVTNLIDSGGTVIKECSDSSSSSPTPGSGLYVVGSQYIMQGDHQAVDNYVSAGELVVSSGAIVTSTVVDAFGALYVSSGGTATGILIASGGTLSLSNQAVACNITYDAGAVINGSTYSSSGVISDCISGGAS